VAEGMRRVEQHDLGNQPLATVCGWKPRLRGLFTWIWY
jgi:hypothetical protein